MNAGQIILFTLIVSSISGCSQESTETPLSVSKKSQVETVQIQEMKPSMKVMLPGELKPWNRVSIMARVRGYMGKVLVDRGDWVKKGEFLAVIEAPEIISELNVLKGREASARAVVIEMESRLNASRLTYERLSETSKTKGAVSANEMDIAYSKMMTDSALTISARGSLEATRAQFVSQQQLVKYLTVVAPFDGLIIDRNVSPGALVGASGDQGVPLFILEDQAKLRLTVAIPESMTNSIPNESEVEFTVPANPGEIFHARLGRSANSLLEQNRSMLAEFDVQNQAGELKAGMYAEVEIPISRSKATLVVPGTALIATSEGVFVIRVVDSKAQWVYVKKGNQIGSQVEIFGNLKVGERIVLLADPEIRDGSIFL